MGFFAYILLYRQGLPIFSIFYIGFTVNHSRSSIAIHLHLTHTSRWRIPLCLLNCFDDPGLAKQVLFQPFKLIDLTQMSLMEFQEHGAAGLMEVLLQHHNEKQLRRLLHNLIETRLWHKGIYEAKRNDYIDLVLNYILNTYDDEYYNQDIIIEELAQADPNNRKHIMSIAERLQQKGEQKGLQKGEHKRQRQIAQKMLQEGWSIEQIQHLTELSIQEINQLK